MCATFTINSNTKGQIKWNTLLLFSGIIALWVKKEYEIQEKMVSETANKHKKESNIDK